MYFANDKFEVQGCATVDGVFCLISSRTSVGAKVFQKSLSTGLLFKFLTYSRLDTDRVEIAISCRNLCVQTRN